jgi:hypothetical protein
MATVELSVFTPEEAAYLREFMRLNPIPPRTGPRPLPVGTPARPEGVRIPDFIGKVTADVDAGTILSSDPVRFQPMYGPEHPLGETALTSPIQFHRAWVAVTTTVWAGCYNRYGKWYVTALECPPPA